MTTWHAHQQPSHRNKVTDLPTISVQLQTCFFRDFRESFGDVQQLLSPKFPKVKVLNFRKNSKFNALHSESHFYSRCCAKEDCVDSNSAHFKRQGQGVRWHRGVSSGSWLADKNMLQDTRISINVSRQIRWCDPHVSWISWIVNTSKDTLELHELWVAKDFLLVTQKQPSRSPSSYHSMSRYQAVPSSACHPHLRELKRGMSQRVM